MIPIGRHGSRGSALILALIAAITIAAIVGAYFSIVSAQHASTFRASESEAAFVLAESGIDAALSELNAGLDADAGGLGSAQGSLGPGLYEAVIEPAYVGPGRYTIRSVGSRSDQRRAVSVVVSPEGATANSFTVAVFADLELRVGSNVRVDSYDSRKGPYESQATKMTSKKVRFANDRGHVASNGDILFDSNAIVFGDATPGVAGSVRLGGSGTVLGTTTPAEEPVGLPPIEVPSVPEYPPLALGASDRQTLPPAEYAFPSLTLDSNSILRVEGPAVLVVGDFHVGSNAQIILDGVGTLTIYVTGSFVVDSKARIESVVRDPALISLKIATDAVADPGLPVRIDSNSVIYGTVYAPRASLVVGSNVALYGAISGSRIALDSNAFIHYDEALGPVTTPTRYVIRSWSEVPP